MQANFRTYENGRHDLKGLYGTYGYTMLPNFELTYACYAVAQAIERYLGETATPLSTGPMTNGRTDQHPPLRRCRRPRRVRLDEYRSHARVRPEKQVRCHPHDSRDNPRSHVFRPGALRPDEMPHLHGRVSHQGHRGLRDGGLPHQHAGREVLYIRRRSAFPRCQVPTQGLRKEFGGAVDYVTTDDPTPEDIAKANAAEPILDRGLQHHESWHCGLCLSYCPVGKWKERFLDKNLTGGAGSVVIKK